MTFSHIFLNGKIVPADKAILPIESVEAMYGFGVYETVKVRNGSCYFVAQHVERLFRSAQYINLHHSFSHETIQQYIQQFVQVLKVESCNLKVLLYGSIEQPQCFIIPLAPYYPERKWYRDGVALMSAMHERWMPQAKTLNMLPSYYFYKKAQENNCYDALFLDNHRNILEGTRTNVYVMKGKKILSPPKEKILEGVTLMTIEKVIAKTDYSIEYRDIPFNEVFQYDAMFLSSTSSKMLPVKRIDDREYPVISAELKALIDIYEKSLEQCQGDFERL